MINTLRFTLSLILVFLLVTGIAQDFLMDNTTIIACSGNFYDSGGEENNYASQEDFTKTFYPSTAGAVLKFTFSSFDVEPQQNCNKDYLLIYDGENVSAPELGTFCGTNSPGEIVATSASGAFTFVFRSNKKNNYSGWSASIECITGGGSYAGLWTGSVSNDWNEGLNWDDGNVPGILTDVTIPSDPTGTNFPESNSGSEALCNDISIEAGAHIHIPSNSSLSVFGEILNNGGESGIVIKSDNSGTGSLMHSTTGVEATVEQYLTSLKWHFIGMPVANEVAGVFDLPAGHSDIYLRTHNESDNTWGDFIVPAETPLELGKGYITWVGNSSGINQDETIEFNGILNTGDFTSGQNGYYDISYTTGHGLNLISNPYPSALQADIQNWPQANNKIAQAVWVWDPDLGNYRFWNGNSGFNNNGYGTLIDGIIPPMQAFLIQTTKNNPWITIPQSSRLNSDQSFYKISVLNENIFSLKVVGNESSDQIFVSFLKEATEGFDEAYDVQKVFGSPHAPQLYTKVSNRDFSINAMPELQDNKIFDLGFECDDEGEFTYTAVDIEFFQDNIEVSLEDTKEGVFQNLKTNPNYTFYYEIDDDPNRFKLHFASTMNISSNSTIDNSVYSSEGNIFVKLPKGQTNAEVLVFNLMGKQITSAKIYNENNKIEIRSSAGHYIVKVVTNNSIITEKVFIK